MLSGDRPLNFISSNVSSEIMDGRMPSSHCIAITSFRPIPHSQPSKMSTRAENGQCALYECSPWASTVRNAEPPNPSPAQKQSALARRFSSGSLQNANRVESIVYSQNSDGANPAADGERGVPWPWVSADSIEVRPCAVPLERLRRWVPAKSCDPWKPEDWVEVCLGPLSGRRVSWVSRTDCRFGSSKTNPARVRSHSTLALIGAAPTTLNDDINCGQSLRQKALRKARSPTASAQRCVAWRPAPSAAPRRG
jgi:hypothetical protein